MFFWYYMPPAWQSEGNYLGFPTLCSIASESFATPWTVAHQAPSVYGIFWARVLERFAISFSRRSSPPRDGTHVSCVSCTAGRFLITESPGKHLILYISRRKTDLGSDAHAYFLFPGRKQTSPEFKHAQKSQHLRKEAIYLFKGATKSPLLSDK